VNFEYFPELLRDGDGSRNACLADFCVHCEASTWFVFVPDVPPAHGEDFPGPETAEKSESQGDLAVGFEFREHGQHAGVLPGRKWFLSHRQFLRWKDAFHILLNVTVGNSRWDLRPVTLGSPGDTVGGKCRAYGA